MKNRKRKNTNNGCFGNKGNMNKAKKQIHKLDVDRMIEHYTKSYISDELLIQVIKKVDYHCSNSLVNEFGVTMNFFEFNMESGEQGEKNKLFTLSDVDLIKIYFLYYVKVPCDVENFEKNTKMMFNEIEKRGHSFCVYAK
jgi:hypothetical protein